MPLNGSEAGGGLVLIHTDLTASRFVNQAVVMLTTLHLNKKNREVGLKARSHPAWLTFIGQAIEHTTVIWPIVSSTPTFTSYLLY